MKDKTSPEMQEGQGWGWGTCGWPLGAGSQPLHGTQSPPYTRARVHSRGGARLEQGQAGVTPPDSCPLAPGRVPPQPSLPTRKGPARPGAGLLAALSPRTQGGPGPAGAQEIPADGQQPGPPCPAAAGAHLPACQGLARLPPAQGHLPSLIGLGRQAGLVEQPTLWGAMGG